MDLTENETLHKALVAVSEDPIAGVDHTRKTFFETVKRKFIELASTASNETAGRYGSHTMVSIKPHFSDMSAYVQKFRSSLLKTKACSPTGVPQCVSAWNTTEACVTHNKNILIACLQRMWT